MAEVEKVLLDRFYQEFWIFLILFVLTMIITAALIIFYPIKFSKMAKRFKIAIPIVSLLLVALCFFSGKLFTKYHDDYVFLATNTPIHITGKVIGYSNVVSHDDLTVTRSWPILLVSETDNPISLNIIDSEEKLVIGQVYDFLYLPNTRIAELVDET
jgi:amino acid transporter